jgi:prepilin-type N-terminal cleavage/methylation domain-containing protein
MKLYHKKNRFSGFSLIEALVTITIIGIITFLALPNVLSVRKDAEDSTARAKAEALNIALVAFVQKYGRDSARAVQWNGLQGTTDNERNERYKLLREFLSFPPNTYRDYMGVGYNANIEAIVINPTAGGGPALGRLPNAAVGSPEKIVALF